MKRFLFFLVFALTASVADAQSPVGTWSIIPRVGVSLAKLSGDEIDMAAGGANVSKSQYRAGFTGGADVMCQVSRGVGLSLGVFYTQRGTDYKDCEYQSSSAPIIYTAFHDSYQRMSDIDVPLMAHLYLTTGLSVGVGLQASFLVDDKFHYEMQSYVFDPETGARQWEPNTEGDYDLKHAMHTARFSVPVGLSYEYQQVVLEARYAFPLSKVYKKKDYGSDDVRNRCFTVTVGYKFDL